MSFFLTVLLLATNPTEAPAADAAPSTKDQAASEKIICRRTGVTGSRVQKKRTCMSAREWQRATDVTQDALNDYLRKATAGAPR